MAGIRNIEGLRDATGDDRSGAGWAWLFGFPGQEIEHRRTLAQLPSLVHLPPPLYSARIDVSQFLRRWRGIPARHAYHIPPDRVDDVVTPITAAHAEESPDLPDLLAALDVWHTRHPGCTLTQQQAGNRLVIRDRRAGWPAADHIVSDRAQLRAWQLLSTPRSPRALARELAAQGIALSELDIAAWLGRLATAGLVFTAATRWITLPCTTTRRGRRLAPHTNPTTRGSL